jgi:hypothetical protein
MASPVSTSRKGLKRYGMRSYLIEGPNGAKIIERDRPWRFFVKDKTLHAHRLGDLFALKFKRLRDAREFAEGLVGL